MRRVEATSPGGADEAVPHPDPRIALLPAQLLQPAETIILLIKPSPWYILLESLGALTALTLLALLGWSLVKLGVLGLSRTDLILLAVGLGGVRLFWQFLEWLSRVYILTDRRAIRVQGVLRVQVFECQLKQIQHTTATFSVRERIVGLGTIGFATAGTAFTDMTWRMVAHPLDVHRLVVQAIERYR